LEAEQVDEQEAVDEDEEEDELSESFISKSKTK